MCRRQKTTSLNFEAMFLLENCMWAHMCTCTGSYTHTHTHKISHLFPRSQYFVKTVLHLNTWYQGSMVNTRCKHLTSVTMVEVKTLWSYVHPSRHGSVSSSVLLGTDTLESKKCHWVCRKRRHFSGF